MYVEDKDWNSSMTHLFYVSYIMRRLLLLFSPGFFQDLKKINVGGGRPAVKFFVGIYRAI